MSINKNKKSTPDAAWHEITPGGTIYTPGNAEEFKTGDWRAKKPLWIIEKCKQCMLCPPTCPELAIPVDGEGNRLEYDYDLCKGCGICVEVCPFDAIDFVDEE